MLLQTNLGKGSAVIDHLFQVYLSLQINWNLAKMYYVVSLGECV